MRTKWDSTANYLLLDAGPFGSAHGHEDKLSFELYAFGKTFLVDPATYTYNEKDKYRYFFLRSSAHNTVIIDGKSQARFWDRENWVYHEGNPNDNIWRSTNKYDYVEGTYKDGYGNYKERVDRSVNHVRKILFVKPEYWVMSDIIEGEGDHIFQQFFHFVPIKLEKSENKSVCTKANSGSNLAIFPVNDDGLSLDIVQGSEDPIQGWISTAFQKKSAAPVAIYTKNSQAPAMFNVILFPTESQITAHEFSLVSIPVIVDGEELKEIEAICLKFQSDDWIDYILLSRSVSGVKKFDKFQSNQDVAYFRVNKNGDIINKFEFLINE